MTFNDLLLLYVYHMNMASELNEVWHSIGDDAYIEMMTHYRLAKACESEIEMRI